MLGHHRHEAPQQHERHHIDHPRCGLAQFFSPEDTVPEDAEISKVPPERNHHVAEYQQQPRRYMSHSHGHSHHDMESLLETPDLEAETDSDDEAELKIGRKRQIIGILVRLNASNLLPW